MQYIYPFIVSFIFIFLSELGDKTQILVLSFSAKNKSANVLLGVALGTLFSHGLAILFGSNISIIGNDNFIYNLKILTYITFLFFGITGFLKLKRVSSETETNSKSTIIKFLGSLTQNCIFIVASSIALGEIGDKTFLACIGLGLEYPMAKISLICGSVSGMVASNSIAIFLGKWFASKISSTTIEILSNIIFIVFGIFGLVGLII